MTDRIYDFVYSQKDRELRYLYPGMKMLLCSDVIITGKDGDVGMVFIPGSTPAPVVVDMSMGALKRIRDLIDAQGILVVEDQELSDILWGKAAIGEFIPKEAYEPVSEWIALALFGNCSR